MLLGGRLTTPLVDRYFAKLSSSRLVQSGSAELRFALYLIIRLNNASIPNFSFQGGLKVAQTLLSRGWVVATAYLGGCHFLSGGRCNYHWLHLAIGYFGLFSYLKLD